MSAFAIITTVRRCDEFRSTRDGDKSATETVNEKEIISFLMNSFLFVVAIVAVVVAVLIKKRKKKVFTPPSAVLCLCVSHIV